MQRRNVILIIVAALGYFVDMYDLVLFGIVRNPSLIDLGVPADVLTDVGLNLLDWQMTGLLLGGVIWGVLGDKLGRRAALFGTILMYSLANIANGFVQDVETYKWLRLIAGIGLAGELGAGVTLVAEALPTNKRGYGAALIAGFGVLGAIAAALTADMFDWRTTYFVGGGMGLLLLLLRAGTFESGLFDTIKEKTNVRRGSLIDLFGNRERLGRFLLCIIAGIPIWYAGFLVILSPEIATTLHIANMNIHTAYIYLYVGFSTGDFASGFISQYLSNRRRVMTGFVLGLATVSALYLTADGWNAHAFYFLCAGLGLMSGYWAVFMTNAAEQFGTNLRATVATSAPNFVRGSVVLMTLAIHQLKPSYGLIEAAALIGVVVIPGALLAIWKLEETATKDLDYLEADRV